MSDSVFPVRNARSLHSSSACAGRLARMTLLPFAEPPTFKTLLRFGSADLISFYQNATGLAEAFSRVYGENYHEKLVSAL